MSVALAERFEKRLIAGKTFKDLTNPQSKSFIVPDSRFKKHCKSNPIWAERVKELNKASITKKWKLTSGHGNATKKFCLRGLPSDDEGQRSDRRRWSSSMPSMSLYIDAGPSHEGGIGRPN